MSSPSQGPKAVRKKAHRWHRPPGVGGPDSAGSARPSACRCARAPRRISADLSRAARGLLGRLERTSVARQSAAIALPMASREAFARRRRWGWPPGVDLGLCEPPLAAIGAAPFAEHRHELQRRWRVTAGPHRIRCVQRRPRHVLSGLSIAPAGLAALGNQWGGIESARRSEAYGKHRLSTILGEEKTRARSCVARSCAARRRPQRAAAPVGRHLPS